MSERAPEDAGGVLAHALDKLGGRAEVVDGIRVTPASELRVVAEPFTDTGVGTIVRGDA